MKTRGQLLYEAGADPAMNAWRCLGDRTRDYYEHQALEARLALAERLAQALENLFSEGMVETPSFVGEQDVYDNARATLAEWRKQ